MGSDAWSGRRLAGVAAIVLVVLFVVILVITGDSPAYDDSADKVRDFFVDSDTQVHLTTWLGALGFVFFLLPFAAGLRNLLASTEQQGDRFWSTLSYTGAVLTVAIGGGGSAFWEVLSQGVAEDLSDETLVALARFDTVVFAAVLPWGFALFVSTASLVIVRSGVLARWIGWLGLVAALAMVIGPLWVFSEDDENFLAIVTFVGMAVVMLWILITGIAMLRPTGEPARTGTGDTTDKTSAV